VPLKIPYRAEAAMCFQQLKGINEIYKNTIDQILEKVNSDIPFREKLEQSVNIHIDNIEDPADTTLIKKKVAKEEDTYLCCFFDVIEGLFAIESETIVNSSFGGEQKRHAMDRMIRILNEVPLGGPRWNHNTQPRILRRLMDMKRQVH
jgi:hypothetical protein